MKKKMNIVLKYLNIKSQEGTFHLLSYYQTSDGSYHLDPPLVLTLHSVRLLYVC